METKNHKPSLWRKGKFTTVDAVILLLVVVMVVGAVIGWVYQAVNKGSAFDEGLTYVVTMKPGVSGRGRLSDELCWRIT